MFYNETINLFKTIAAIQKRSVNNIILPYKCNTNLRSFKIKKHEKHYEFIMELKEQFNLNRTPQPPAPPTIAGTFTISNPSQSVVYSRTIRVLVSLNFKNLLLTEWRELSTNNTYYISANMNTQPSDEDILGNIVMSSMFLDDAAIINGVLYLKTDADAFLTDIIGDNKFSVLEVLDLAKDFENVLQQ